MTRSARFVLSALALAPLALAQPSRPTLTGHVVDSEGAPITGAHVSIATAAVKEGVSPY